MARLKKQEIINKTFNCWTVLSDAGYKKGAKYYNVECKCGYQTTRTIQTIKKSKSKECPGNHKEQTTRKGLTTHPLAKAWRNMNYRCNPEYSKKYKNYQSYKGCKVSKEWSVDNPKGLENFISDMEPSYVEGYELDKDKLGNGKLYSKETCCWINPLENKKMVKPSKFTPEVIKKLIELREEGLSYRKIAKKLNVGATQAREVYLNNK